MLGFLIGLFVGGIVGIIIMSMMHIASNEDERMEKNLPTKNNYNQLQTKNEAAVNTTASLLLLLSFNQLYHLG